MMAVANQNELTNTGGLFVLYGNVSARGRHKDECDDQARPGPNTRQAFTRAGNDCAAPGPVA